MKTAFVAHTRVRYTTSAGGYLRGEVVGPDQTYFPSPVEVFVSFAATGRTCLLPVTDLTIDPPLTQLRDVSRLNIGPNRACTRGRHDSGRGEGAE
ncbi:MAG: hypothetical protein ACREX3_18595 [Gammaproteobacteria bacterium]